MGEGACENDQQYIDVIQQTKFVVWKNFIFLHLENENG